MSISSFIFGIWISTICVVGAILLCGVLGMAVYRVTHWDFRRIYGAATAALVKRSTKISTAP